MAHLIFLTSTPASVAAGSGTWVGISVLRDALIALGHEVTLISASANGTALSRILFNLSCIEALPVSVWDAFCDAAAAPATHPTSRQINNRRKGLRLMIVTRHRR